MRVAADRLSVRWYLGVRRLTGRWTLPQGGGVRKRRLGVLGRSGRLFQGVYLMLWYMVVNSVAALDFMGAIRENGHLLGPSPVLVLGAGANLVAVALLTQEARHARR